MAFSTSLVSSLIIFISLLFTFSEAKHFLVGGKPNAWMIPSSQSDTLNAWAEKNRFQIGDSLVWNFDGEKDSVLQVTKMGYDSCNTTDPIVAYKGGNVTVELERSGSFLFISGQGEHCKKGEKLHVVVMSEKKKGGGISPAPSSTESGGLAKPPASGSSRLAVLKSGFGFPVGFLMAFVGMVL
ncbi:early nodulin-like protein 3 [Cinnamomum micranthum f. kanehirae]|uniref:Early nodulin-like protein 3 n=1 Tax=Cinnamomum micranthum f. kanehirae TaxID=337451 RepID=A0A3S3MFI4_9MAGN|nr:early nodulin-like protein 3 [Cinnamomum micranthum f. kanehirae]